MSPTETGTWAAAPCRDLGSVVERAAAQHASMALPCPNIRADPDDFSAPIGWA